MLIPLRTFSVQLTPTFSRQVAIRFVFLRLFHHAHQSFAIMPQRTIYLLKHSNSDPVIVASIHCLSLKSNSIYHLPVHTSLITAYARACCLDSSLSLFEESTINDVISWNAVISACVITSQYHVPILIFQKMVEEYVEFNPTTLVSLLSAVSCARILKHGRVIHGIAIKKCFSSDPCLCNALVTMYSKCGDWSSSELVFQTMQFRDTTSWNSIISAAHFVKFYEKSISYFTEMKFCGFQPDELRNATRPVAVTLITVIPPCGELNLLLEVKSIHGYSIRYEMQTANTSIANSLMDAYFNCGHENYARKLFDKMPKRDLFSWNTIISGYAEIDFLHQDARHLFSELLRANLRCNLPSFLGILLSVSRQEDLNFGKSIHGMVFKYGYDSSISVINALMHMYMTCNKPSVSFNLLKSIVFESDVISWNTIITGCVQKGLVREALVAFQFMHSNLNLSPDSITLASALSACADLELCCLENVIHGYVLKRPVQHDVRVRKALVTFYLKVGDLKSANKAYEFTGERDLCIWNCMISNHVQNGEGGKALELYHGSRDQFSSLNEITVVSLLGACSQIGDIKHGKEINGHIFRYGLQNNVFIMASLIDLYSKCGMLDLAMKIFEISEEKSIASWNSMISAYGLHGQGENSIGLFKQMCDSGIKPTKITFVALLSACSLTGLVEEGLKYYKLMPQKFGIRHSIEHVVCVVDLLGRAGRVNEAYEFVKELGVHQDHGVWGALLSACNDFNGDANTGKTVAGRLFCMQPENPGYYVTLCNLFASHEMWNYVEEIRRIFRDKGLVKPRAFSEIDNLS